jgi:hypothetical protein
MSVKNALSSAWRIVSKDPGVVIGTVQIIVALSDIIVRQLSSDFNTRQEWSACALEKWATTESQNDLVIWLGNGVAKDLI